MIPSTTKQPRKPRTWTDTSIGLLLFVLVIAELNHSFEQNMVAVALPRLYKEFGDPFTVGWSITAYALVAAATAATAGRLGDVLGRKQVLVAALLLGTLGSAIVVFSPTLPALIAGRAVQGSTGAILGLAFGIVTERLGKERSATAIALLAGTALIGGGLGSFVAGALVDSFGWHSIFYLSAAFALLSVILSAALLPPSERRGSVGDVDLLGGTFLAIGVTLILLSLTLVRSLGWTNALVVSALVVGLAVIAFWVAFELKVASPTVDLRSLTDPRISIAHLAMLLAAGGIFSMGLISSVVLQTTPKTGIGLGLSATTTALFLTGPAVLSGLLLSPFAGRISSRHGAGMAMLVGSLIAAVGFIPLLFAANNAVVLLLGLTAGPVGTAFIVAAAPNLLLKGIPAERTSEASNLNQVMKSVGLAIAPLVFSTFLATNLVSIDGAPTPSAASFQGGFAYMAAIAVGLILLSFIAIKVERNAEKQVDPQGIPARVP